jgi:Rrf2 family protein
MRITLRGYYAILALTSMARAEVSDGRLRIEDIARRHPIPEAFLLQIFQVLKRSGLVQSRRGARGGFHLARPAEKITLAEIIESVEGKILPCPTEERGDLLDQPPAWRELNAFWDELRGRVRATAEEYTLADLADRIYREEGEMYHI